MSHLNVWAYLATWAIVIAVIVVGWWWNKKRPQMIVIPRTSSKHGTPGGCNAEGMLIEENTCPECGEKGFYQGRAMSLYHTIYCGNSKCRAVWMVVNYGPGQIWAHRDEGQGPQHLYQ